MDSTVDNQSNSIATSTEEQKISPDSDKPISWYSILGLGAMSTSRFLLPLLAINSVLVVAIYFLGQIKLIHGIPILDPAFLGYLVYFLNWGAFFDYTSPISNITQASFFSLILVSLYTLIFTIIGMHFDPKDITPWWKQLKGMHLPTIINFLSSLVTLIVAETLPLIVIIVLNSGSSVNSSELINSIIVSIIFIISISVVVVFIEIGIIFLYDETSSDKSISSAWDQLRKFWYEGIFIFLAFPLALVVLLLGGTLLIFFPVLILNFLTNGTVQTASGAIMTQLLQILIFSILFFYPAYPALTWGQFYKHKLEPRAKT